MLFEVHIDFKDNVFLESLHCRWFTKLILFYTHKYIIMLIEK